MDLHPDTRHDDGPCLVDGLQHREKQGKADAACYARSVVFVSLCFSSSPYASSGRYSQRAHPKNTYQPHLLRAWHLQPNHHRHRQNKQQDICGHIQHRRRHIKRRSVNAASFSDGNIPIPSERRTGEDEWKDESDVVADDEEHACVDT